VTHDTPPAGSWSRRFPDQVPILADPERGVTLRAHQSTDIADIVDTCRDPDALRWTAVPTPAGGYGPTDARDFLARVAGGLDPR